MVQDYTAKKSDVLLLAAHREKVFRKKNTQLLHVPIVKAKQTIKVSSGCIDIVKFKGRGGNSLILISPNPPTKYNTLWQEMVTHYAKPTLLKWSRGLGTAKLFSKPSRNKAKSHAGWCYAISRQGSVWTRANKYECGCGACPLANLSILLLSPRQQAYEFVRMYERRGNRSHWTERTPGWQWVLLWPQVALRIGGRSVCTNLLPRTHAAGPPNGVEHLKLCTQGAPQLLAEAKEAHPTRARGGHEDVTRRRSVSATEGGYAG